MGAEYDRALRERDEARACGVVWKQAAKRWRGNAEHALAMLEFVRDSYDMCAAQRDEARQWAIRMKQERDALQARAETLDALLGKHCDVGSKLVDEKNELKAKVERLRAELADESDVPTLRCETCKYRELASEPDSPWYECIYGEVCAPNNFDRWEARDD